MSEEKVNEATEAKEIKLEQGLRPEPSIPKPVDHPTYEAKVGARFEALAKLLAEHGIHGLF